MMWHLVSAADRLSMRIRGGAYRNTLAIKGTFRCGHRSHVLRLRCLRPWTWDGYCAHHNTTCWDECA